MDNLYFVVTIDKDAYTEVLEMKKLDDKLISLYLNLINFKLGKVLTFKGELVDVEFKNQDLCFVGVKDILHKYKFLKDNEEKCHDFNLIKDYIEKIYFEQGDLKIED